MMNPKQCLALAPARIGLILKLVGLLILLGGLSSARAIWLKQDRLDRQTAALVAKNPAAADVLDPMSPDDSRRYTHDAELYYGKTGLLMDKLWRHLEGLTHGKGLADTIAVGSVVAAVGCFWFAKALIPPA